MIYKSFCYFATQNLDIPSNKPIPIDSSNIIGELVESLREDGDFFGLVDSCDTTLQVAYEEEGSYWIEIPFPKERGSYGQSVSLDQLCQIMSNLPETFTREAFPDFEFVAWG